MMEARVRVESHLNRPDIRSEALATSTDLTKCFVEGSA